MDDLTRFVNDVDAYLQASQLTPTAFGSKAAGDPNFVFELKNGREPRRSTIAKVREFMSREPVTQG